MTEFRAPEVDDFDGQIIAEFQANGGKVGGPFQGSDMLLLHHTGVTVRARIAQPAERDVIYSRQKHRNPVFADYEVKAAPRRIPVVVLDPIK